MARQSATPRKKRGPPPTGKGQRILVRLRPVLLADVDAWIAHQTVELSRPEAIRRLVEQALTGSPTGQRSAKARSKARQIASAQLDKLIDPSAPEEERQQRKQRLLKGPKEFRDMRNQIQSKAKRSLRG